MAETTTQFHSRMVIGECISTDQVNAFVAIFHDNLPTLRTEPGFVSYQLMVEDGGAMVVMLTNWKSRNDCLRYHSSRAYRTFVQRTQHFLLGNFVVKLFRSE